MSEETLEDRAVRLTGKDRSQIVAVMLMPGEETRVVVYDGPWGYQLLTYVMGATYKVDSCRFYSAAMDWFWGIPPDSGVSPKSIVFEHRRRSRFMREWMDPDLGLRAPKEGER